MATLEEQIVAVRKFNRFYTPLVGLLQEGYLDSPFSLTQVRVLYELAHSDGPTATEIARSLSLDPGYLSRLLRGFTDVGLVEQHRSATDGRRRILTLTEHGRAVFEPLDRRSHDDIAGLLARLTADDRQRLVAAMASIEEALGEREAAPVPYVLRPPRPGDLG